MKLYEAKNIIQETFENKFEKEKFAYFIKNLLKNLEVKPFGNGGAYTGNLIPRAFQSVIRKMERIGKFEDEEGNLIDVLIVELKSEHSIEYARTTQRNFIRWYLNGSRGNQFKDAALVAFHTEKSPDWRFSLIKMQYSLEKGKDILTPAKRSSFLVGEQGKSHTAQQQLVPLLKNDYSPYLSDLEEAFNIEAVSDEFYEKYKAQLFNLKDELDKIVENDNIIKTEFEQKNIDTLNFAKKLLGQIVFLYFLQKKGWLGLKEGQSYGGGNRNFMRDLFMQAKSKGKNFFNDYLEFLFYDALSKKRTTDFYEKFNCRIPFLNGGLFDPIKFYNWEKTDIIIPNKLFSNKTDDDEEGTGILDIFDLYNFTVKEDEPLEKEVAIDPEMLGKVFERMLEVKERKSKGAFYTPREIVHYMAQQSLTYFLDTELQGKVSKANLKTFIHFGEQIIDKDIAIETGKLKESNNKYQIPESIRNNANAIDKALENIKICDPAVGSGAFPVGVMNEIVKLRNLLTEFMNDKKYRTSYFFKSNAIQNSIYGVDIDAGAVEIAKLRLWLSMVVDESNINHIDPLPNLEYRIVRGNSLINMPNNTLRNIKLENKIQELIKQYYTITDKQEKQRQKQIIDEKIIQLLKSASEWAGYKIDFDFKLYFHEVFNEEDGFDVVIGNPPYIMEYENKKAFAGLHKHSCYQGKTDIWHLFTGLGLDLLKNKGVVTYIAKNQWLTSSSASNMREKIYSDSELKFIIDFGANLMFENADVQTMVFLAQKNYNNDSHSLNYIRFEKQDINNIKQALERNAFKFNKKNIEKNYDKTANLTFSSSVKENILEKINSKKNFEFDPKKEIIQGIIGGPDKAFIVKKDELNKFNDEEKEYLKMLHTNTGRFFTPDTDKYIFYISKKNFNNKNIDDYLNIKNKLLEYREQLENRREVLQGARRWFDLWWERDENFFKEGSKIIFTSRTAGRDFTYTEKAFYGSRNLFFIKSDKVNLKYITALLNSKLMYFYMSERLKHTGDLLQLDKNQFLKIPLFVPDDIKPFIDLVDKILKITSIENYDPKNLPAEQRQLEAEIDEMVFDLYELTEEERKIVRGNL